MKKIVLIIIVSIFNFQFVFSQTDFACGPYLQDTANQQMCIGFTPFSACNPIAYLFDYGNGDTNNTVGPMFYSCFHYPGFYTVKLIVTCSNMSLDSAIHILYVASPTYGDCNYFGPAGVIFLNNSKINISPNPAFDELIIENLPANGNGSTQWQAGAELRIKGVEIYNTLGEKRLTVSASSTHRPTLSKGEGVRVDVSSLPAGVYFVAVTDDKGNKITSKFIKL